MYCDHCGAENRSLANFCYKCGANLVLIPSTERKAISAEAGKTPAPDQKPVGAVENGAGPSVEIDESTTPESLGRLLNGRYELKEFLGRGGMGVVYRAYDKELRMDVAIKFLLARHAHNFAAIESLKQEAKAAMHLSHQNIVRLYNFEDTPRVKYILMEYIQGESLAALAAKRTGRRFTEPEVIRFMCDVCDALAYAHNENIVHRDIKPSNILVTGAGKIKIADFGIAVMNGEVGSEIDDVAGTPSYMSPEQILGNSLDGRSDIYSLGLTMYEMLAGRQPFRGKDVRFRCGGVLPDPVDGISDWLNGIILKCVRKEPDARWLNAQELKDVLSGKREGGLALKAKFQPWWVVAEEMKKAQASKSAPAEPVAAAPAADSAPAVKKEKEIKAPDCKRARVRRTPLPMAPERVQERVEKLERHVGLAEYASEREQARMAYGTIAGILAGALFFLIARSLEQVLSQRTLLQLGFMLFGGSVGIAVGFAHKRLTRGAVTFLVGVLGGILAGLLVPIGGAAGDPTITFLYTVRPPQTMLLCTATVGLFLGVAEGIRVLSLRYLIACALWGAVGGAMGSAVFILIRYLFSSFWSPFTNWVTVGATLGFFVMMAIGLAKKPGINDQRKK